MLSRIAILVTACSWLLVNAPFLLVLNEYDASTARSVFVLAPNQFLFLLIFFPAAVYLTTCAAQKIGEFIRARSSVKWWCTLSLIWVLSLAGAGVFTYFDYQSDEAPDLYQLRYDTAVMAVAAVDEVLKYLNTVSTPDGADLRKQSRTLADEGRRTPPPDPSQPQILQLDDKMSPEQRANEASRFLLLVGSYEQQKTYQLTDGLLRKSNAVELFVAMVGLMHLVAWTLIAFAINWRYPGRHELRRAALFLGLGAAFLTVFAFGTSYNLSVRDLCFGHTRGVVRADLFAAVGFVVLAFTIAAVFLREDWRDMAKIVVPAVMGLAAFAFVAAKPELALQLLGPSSNPAKLFMVLFISVVVTGLLLFMVLVEPKHD